MPIGVLLIRLLDILSSVHIEWKRHRILTSPNTYCSGNLVILVRWRFSTTCNLLWISFKEFKFSLRRILPSILESKYCDCVLSREWLIMPKFLSKALKLELLLSSDFASSYWLTFAYITVFPLCMVLLHPFFFVLDQQLKSLCQT